jgi:hypothetical protein
MSPADLAFGRRVVYQGQAAVVMDILYRAGFVPRVQIRILEAPGRPVQWVRLAELEAEHAHS